MNRLLFICAALALLTAPVLAQQSQFVPFTVNEADVQQLDFLLSQNAMVAHYQVVQSWLTGLERHAMQEAAAKAAAEKAKAKADEVPKAPKKDAPK